MDKKQSNACLEIYNQIEAKKMQLRDLMNKYKNNLVKDEVVKLSQELDVLIVKYYSINKIAK